MAKRKPLTAVSYQEVINPETGEKTLVRWEDLTPEQLTYYRKLQTDRLIAACNEILNKNPKFALSVIHDP